MSTESTIVEIDKEKIEITKYVEQLPYVNDDGIYMPLNTYVPEGCASSYKCIMTKEMFVEAYNKWIKNA